MINTAMLLGRVGKKEVKNLKSGDEFTYFSLATNKRYKVADGQYKENTTWHNVNCFNKLSEIASKYVHVGDLVFVQGEIQNRKIASGEHAGQYAYSINASDIRLIPKGTKAASESNNSQTKLKEELEISFPFKDDESFPW